MTDPVDMFFGKHLPDQPALGNPGTPFVENVVPAAGFLRPFNDITALSDALTARAQGGVAGRDTTGNVYTFAGDATKLYKLSSSTFSDVSRTSGGAYATPSDGHWNFVPWSDDILIALNGIDDPQKIDPQTGANFTALGGSPPAARYGAIVRNFVFLANWTNNENVVQWSALDNAEEYNTDGTNQSDQQALASGGPIVQILGGEVGTIFSQTSIHRAVYQGSPVIFSFDEVSPNLGLIAPGAVAQFGGLKFFIGQNSFYMMTDTGSPIPIGESKFNKTFFAELDQNNLDKISSAIDPINTIWLVAYPTSSSSNGLPDRIFMYNWASKDCAFVTIDTEMIMSALTTGTALDSLGSDLDALAFSLDSRVYQGGSLILGGFDRSHKLGFFNGDTLRAQIETGERDLGANNMYISGARPLVDASDVTVAIYTRFDQNANPMTAGATSVEADGRCPADTVGRYARARMIIPAGSSWTKAQGVQVYGGPEGEV